MIWYVQVQYYYTLGLSLKFNPRLVITRKFRYRAPKTGAFTTRALLSRNYNARENSLQLPNPDTRNPPSNPEPKGPLVQIGGGYFCNTPYILDKRVPKSWFPCRCQNRRISGRGSRTVRLRLMVTGGGGARCLPRFGPSRWR